MRVIDFYRFPIVIDWLVSITIDYVRFLSSIENIDLLRPGLCKLTCETIFMIDTQSYYIDLNMILYI